MISWTNWLSTCHGNWTLYAVELTSTDTWMFTTNLLAEIVIFIVVQKSSLIFLFYFCCYLLTERTWVDLLINGITVCSITWRTLTLAVQKCGSSLVSELWMLSTLLGFFWNTWISQNSMCYVIYLFLPAICWYHNCYHSLLQVCSSDVRLPQANILVFLE
jgi:hypothetical protein